MKLLPDRKQIQRATAQTQAPLPLLTKLEQATVAVKEFQENHEDTFVKYRELMEEVAVRENEVKTYCKQNRTSLVGSFLQSKFAPAFHRWYDPDTLMKELRDALGIKQANVLAESMDLIVTRQEVDEAVLKSLVKLGKIPETVMKAAYREEETQVRVTIEEK